MPRRPEASDHYRSWPVAEGQLTLERALREREVKALETVVRELAVVRELLELLVAEMEVRRDGEG